ncbi:Hypothetical protein I595_182 [Croceitalea dokdonensis DOKDO 023]|uniref:Uncharacterized protein n=1 Tax=Croceitalea dokdonensis DOKDO 023 TaxID=1300341 RepID=A0A0P7AWY8_9FLAO|nr:hypothetical protein [Croceitalea dokdonensis]KPM33279.1 Hypothetical protein I595_182 [Croceitalea dokdonensis DOKDO 023]
MLKEYCFKERDVASPPMTKPFKLILICCLLTFAGVGLAQEIPAKDWQIKTALMAVPDEFRKGAKVYGYGADGKFITLKEGTNDYIAIASDPYKENFSTAAYHKDLDEFMERGRQLKAEGKEFQEIFDIRETEVKSGKLKMPDKATLCVFTGEVNKTTMQIENPYVRYVFYIPFATGETTGLPTTPSPPGHAWLMNPGTHRAHIMITPPKE